MQSGLPNKIEPNRYCREMAASKKYDCDLKFYDQLSEELKLLEMWDENNVVNNIKEQVMKIKDMTIMHARSLDEDETPDEKEVRQIAENIRQALINLDTSSIPKIIEKMDQMQGNSASRAVLETLVQEESGKYSETISKLAKSIHNPQNRTENVLLIGLFYLINSQNGEKMINTYKTLIEKAMEEFKLFKGQIAAIPRDSFQEVVESQKFKGFVEGTKLIYKTASNLYDVLRIISGQSNLKFKLSTLRSEINQSIANVNQEFNTRFDPIEEQSAESSKRELRDFIAYVRTKDSSKAEAIKSEYCSFCMLPHNLVQVQNRVVHVSCWNIIKTLSMK